MLRVLRIGTLLAFALAAGATGAAANECKSVDATYDGTFNLSFGTGPGGSSELHFNGSGTAGHLGDTVVNGYSTLGPGSSPICFALLTDAVSLVAADGSTIALSNSGQDCLDFSRPPATHIVGEGASAVTGGSHRFSGATGGGTYAVDATVTGGSPGAVSGTFTLTFHVNVCQ